VLSAIHTDLDETYGDGVVIRVQPPCSGAKGERLEPLRAHRDTWGSNLPAQINWWAPLDMAAGSGAPDVDGSVPFMTPQIFRHLKSGRKLGELVRK